jgi:hypothetical protein
VPFPRARGSPVQWTCFAAVMLFGQFPFLRELFADAA